MTAGEFDYVIIGAGSAGCVLAERLTANGRHRVLVIEAGGSDKRWAIRMPLGYAFTFADPRVTWAYTAAPDPGLNGRSVYWPRGRVIGGCSSINAMAYVRGLPEDYDDWERQGAAGWTWQSVQQAFAALECERWVGDDGDRHIRGSGPVPVSDLRAGMHPMSTRFLQAAAEVGWPVNGPDAHMDHEGIAYYRSTVHHGRRVSAADAFLTPARRRRNLDVLSNAVVTRLDVDDPNRPRVHIRHGEREFAVTARTEVILSAGAINSPHLLQLSGIGPADLLASHGVRVVRNLRQVGRGLQDHLAVTYRFEASKPTLNSRLGPLPGRMVAGLQYLLNRGGPLGVPINQVGGFVRSVSDRKTPDIQMYCNPVTYSIPPAGKPRLDRIPGYSLSAQPCRPTSRGEVRMVSPDPAVAPAIQPNSLATEEDRRSAVAAGRLIQALATAPSLSAATRSPGAQDLARMDDEALLDSFRERASTVFHPCCTCRMGTGAENSVVDSRLRVHGIPGLRVVDASAFPSITSGNINAPTLMLAHRAADMILEDAGPKTIPAK